MDNPGQQSTSNGDIRIITGDFDSKKFGYTVLFKIKHVMSFITVSKNV